MPGTIVDWLSRNTLAIVVGAGLGLAAAADISAARLLVMPAALCVTAWGKVFTPRFSRWWGAGDTRLLDTVSRVSVIALVAIMAAYTAVLVPGFDLLQRFVLGGEYATAKPLLLTWAIYFAIRRFAKSAPSPWPPASASNPFSTMAGLLPLSACPPPSY